jgi:hypothetical protein
MPQCLYAGMPVCPNSYGPRLTYLRLAEPSPDPISEAELSWIWEGQRYPEGALLGRDGAAVAVLNPGQKGAGPGPDFRNAVVRIGGEERKGDVELHVRASSYLQHGHHLDPGYDGLVLHVVFLDDVGGASPLACGETAPVAAFAPWVEARSADIASWLGRPPLWREPCQTAAVRFGRAGVAEQLRLAGRARFLARMEYLEALAAGEGEGEAIWQAVMEALGYGGDRDGFLRLARALPASLLRDLILRLPQEAQATLEDALLSVGGLSRAPAPLAGLLPPALRPGLRSGGGRPANRPQNRLAAAALLFLRARGDIAAYALQTVREAGSVRELISHWSASRRGRGSATLGVGRSIEILLNAVLPFAARQYELREHSLELAAGLPALPPYGKTAFLERNLAPGDGKRPVKGALDQQGLLDLHARWCSQGGCGKCPLS